MKFKMQKKLMTVLCFTALLLGISLQQAMAQSTVTGTITDASSGDAIPFASVVVKGTMIGVTADEVGAYSIAVPEGSKILEFSSVGYDNSDVEVGGRSIVNAALKASAETLEEVIVTGYGTIKKSAYGGSASIVKTAKLQDVPVTSFADLLSGNAPGVSVGSTSGQPGSSSNIRIRGMGSFNASNNPLYVIDGVPVISGDVGASNSSSTSGISKAPSSSTSGLDIMSTISTSDIENITIIKDAAAASLYGSRAANGVILITTKSGKKGNPSFSMKADMGFSDFAMDYRPVMGGAERRETMKEGLYNRAISDGKSEAAAQQHVVDNIDKYAPVPWNGYADWNDALFQKGKYQNYEFSASGGTDNMRYYSSLGYTDQEGLAKKSSGLKRVSARVNVDYNATKKLTLGVKGLFSNVNQDIFSEGTGYTSPFYSSRNSVTPSDHIFNEDGSYNQALIRNGRRNPKLSQDYNYRKQGLTRAFNTLFAQYQIIDELKFRSTFGYDYNLSKYETWDDPRTSDGEASNGSKTKRMVEYRKMAWSNTLSYEKKFAEKHNFDALIAFDIESYDRDFVSGNGKNFINPDKEAVSNAAEPTSVSGYMTQWRMASFISRLNYDYDSRYYFGASFRTDGSSRFQESSRWGNFWSVSGTWRAINEEFMSDLKHTITDLRLRTSYGVNGTQPTEYYGFEQLASLGYSYMGNPGMRIIQLQNHNLKWETNYNFHLGLDVGLFNRINMTVEYFNRTTKNLLMDFPISRTTGFSSYLSNVGEVRNTGIEVDINTTNITSKDFEWTTNFNIGHTKIEILKLDGISTQIPSGNQIRKIGRQYYSYYLVEFAGIDTQDGTAMFYTNKPQADGSLSRETTKDYAKADRIPYKGYEPKVRGGLGNHLKYKWFDLNFVFAYQFGGYGYDNWAQKTEHGGGDMKANIPVYYRDRWKKPGDVAQYEKFIANHETPMNSNATTRRIHSSDYIRLKNITFGVTVPNKWTKKAGVNSVRVYCAGSNLFTWAKWSEYDPESIGSDGVASWEGPPLKTITFGIDIKF